MDEFLRLMLIKQKYAESKRLAQFFMREDLKKEFESFESPSVKKAAMQFLDDEIKTAETDIQRNMAKLQAERKEGCDRVKNRLQDWKLRNISKTVAKAVIEESAWWLTHSSGSPVRAPRHSDRIESDNGSWLIDFGANSFLISSFVSRAATCLLEPLAEIKNGKLHKCISLQKLVRKLPARCVSNYNRDVYEFYALEGDFLVFGAQALSLNDLSESIISASGISSYAC